MSDFIMTCPWCDGVVEITNVLHNPGKRTIILTTKCAGCGTIVKFKHQYNNSPIEDAIRAWNRRQKEKKNA